ncbi:hypothetical protein QO010_002916 [Caulobacter ginsengisoli]|uniref:TonB C-terminal domain-containing protein n=1 Tax=Caulobacter ginsengisoli TaxID=400775 RepID=A0ABU0ISZ4_9CAUL|nr:hypothetical protein [Caulobacter ginsengisoli]MDQ0465132.1 hypothetical protein [Caulobacter ginsengisoli]
MEPKWRRPGLLWIDWATLMFGVWLSLLFASLLDRHQFVGVMLGMPVAVLVRVAGYLVLRLFLPLFLKRLWPPVPARPPPAAAESQINYQRPPRLLRPLLALARGQDGWVQFRLRFDREGRVRDYLIEDQSPPGVFDRAMKPALRWTRLPAQSDGPALRQARGLFIFADSRKPPSWAEAEPAA